VSKQPTVAHRTTIPDAAVVGLLNAWCKISMMMRAEAVLGMERDAADSKLDYVCV
jgi:hypothetical protein